jgi:hypothetical protein
VEIGVPEGKADAFLPSYMPFIQLGLARYARSDGCLNPAKSSLKLCQSTVHLRHKSCFLRQQNQRLSARKNRLRILPPQPTESS